MTPCARLPVPFRSSQFLRMDPDMDQENSFDYFFINFPRPLRYCERELSLPQECPFRTDQMQGQSLWITLLRTPKCFLQRYVHHFSEEHTIRLNITANLRCQFVEPSKQDRPTQSDGPDPRHVPQNESWCRILLRSVVAEIRQVPQTKPQPQRSRPWPRRPKRLPAQQR